MPKSQWWSWKGSPHSQSFAPQEWRPVYSPGFSPSELLMGRRLRTKVPAMHSVFKGNVQDSDRQRAQQIKTTDSSQQTTPSPCTSSTAPWRACCVQDQNREGHIIGAAQQQSSYLVKTGMSKLRQWFFLSDRLEPTSLKPATPSDSPAMAPRDQACPWTKHRRLGFHSRARESICSNSQDLLDHKRLLRPTKDIWTLKTLHQSVLHAQDEWSKHHIV